MIDHQAGNDRVDAGAGNDIITGGAGLDVVDAGRGDDTVVATIGDGPFDAYAGGAGSDTFDMSAIAAPITVSPALFFSLSSQTGLDALTSIESVSAGSRDDPITGNLGANRLDGGAGNNTINAGAGNDIVNCGPGNDVFLFVPGFGADRIFGFAPGGGQDLLDISAFGITSETFAARVAIVDVGRYARHNRWQCRARRPAWSGSATPRR